MRTAPKIGEPKQEYVEFQCLNHLDQIDESWPEYDDIEKNWKVMTQSSEGKVSLIKDLTEKEANHMKNSLLGKPRNLEEKIREQLSYSKSYPRVNKANKDFTDKDWAIFKEKFPGAHGIRFLDGVCMGWHSMTYMDKVNYIESVEIFQ